MAGEPIGVAFVEVRPEVENFQATAEQDIRAGLGTDALKVQSEVELTGVDAARTQLAGLTDEVSRTVAELAKQTSPDFAQGFVAGAQEAITSAIELNDVTQDVNTSVITGTEARAQFAAANQRLAVSEAEVAAGHRAAGRAAASATKEERLLSLGRERTATLGGASVIGRGALGTAAVVAAFQAQQHLQEALRVTGAEAGTTGGQLRNAFANLVSLDVVGAIGALQNETHDFNLEQLKVIAASPEVAKGLRDMGAGADIAKGQLAALEGLTNVPQFIQTRLARTDLTGDKGGQLDALNEAQEALIAQEKVVRQLGLDQQQLNIALEAIFRERKRIADQIDEASKATGPDVLAPLVEAVTDARLTGDANRIVAALAAEAAELQRVIAAETTNAEDRRRFKDQLLAVNRDIEATQAAVKAEMERHTQETLEGFLAPVATSALENEASGNTGGQLRSLQAEALMIQGLLPMLKAFDTATSNTYEEFLNRLVSVNGQIESIQDGITAETERHARDSQDKLDDADQAFLRSFDNRVHKANMAKTAAAATVGLADDIAVSNRLQAIYRQEIRVAAKRIHDKELRDDTIAQLTEQLGAEAITEKQLRQQNRADRVARREEALDLAIQLASANENTAAEIRAHRAKIRFLTERIRHTREGTNQRKRLRVAIAEERQSIRELQEDQKDETEGGKFNEIAFSFLQELQGFSSNLASNVLPGNFTLKPIAAQPSTGLPRPQFQVPGVRPPTSTNVPSPFERNDALGRRGRGRPDAEAAAALREGGGQPATAGQMSTLIHLTTNTNRLLGDLKRGVGHPEAKTARDLARHKGSTVSVD